MQGLNLMASSGRRGSPSVGGSVGESNGGQLLSQVGEDECEKGRSPWSDLPVRLTAAAIMRFEEPFVGDGDYEYFTDQCQY